MLLVSDVLTEVVESIDASLNFYYVNFDGTNYECRTTNTLWFKTKNKLVLDGNEYTVVSFVLNEKLVLSGSESLSKGSYQVANPTFKHGKLKPTVAEIQRAGNRLGYPLIWMYELTPRQQPNAVDSILESTGSVKIFILNTTDYPNFTTVDHYKEVLAPLNNLQDIFIRRLKKHKRIGKIVFAGNVVNHAKFTNDVGLTDSQGNNILPQDLCAIELDLNIPIKINLNCRIKNIPEPSVEGSFDSGFNEGFANQNS